MFSVKIPMFSVKIPMFSKWIGLLFGFSCSFSQLLREVFSQFFFINYELPYRRIFDEVLTPRPQDMGCFVSSWI